MEYREEHDSMGPVRVPSQVYYGSQTQRAVENFPISGLRLPSNFIRALALIKKCAARVNRDLGLLEEPLAGAVIQAAAEIVAGRFEDQFVVDVFQTGSGTSTHMNANEVIAGRANEILTGNRGGRRPVHPNDHVNRGQSSNDVIPAALHVAAAVAIHIDLTPGLQGLQAALAEKSVAFADVRKIGRTHLQDAVPMTLGQGFSGHAGQISRARLRMEAALEGMLEIAVGGTAVGTGVNTHPEFGARVAACLRAESGLAFRETGNHFQAQGAQDAVVQTSGTLKTVAVALVKIANDLRWLSSGPRCGLGELNLPALQPGSSIMPGKVNPVIPEAVIQAAYQAMGNDGAITAAGQSGNLELNVSLPLMAHNLLQSIQILAAAVRVLDAKCIRGITANREHCAAMIESSLAMATGLVPHLGYDRAAQIAKKAWVRGRSIREVAMEEAVLSPEKLDAALKL